MTMTQILTLAAVPPGSRVRIVQVAEHPSTGRLMAMGLRPGLEVTLVRKAAFGQAFYVQADYQQYGIRMDEAEAIWVEYVH